MIKFNSQTGWLSGVRHVPSPHHRARPENTDVDLLVIHNISLPPGEFGGEAIDQLFMGTLDTTAHPFYEQLSGMTVSSHFLIRRDGEIVQYVSVYEAAWHAGLSCWKGRERCNEFSIGIELEGTDHDPYVPIQYERLAELVSILLPVFPSITLGRIVGHSDVASGRKTDPGDAFDWDLFRQKLQLLYNVKE